MRTVRNARVEKVESDTLYVDCIIKPGTVVDIEGSEFCRCTVESVKFERAYDCAFCDCEIIGNIFENSNTKESVFYNSIVMNNNFSHAEVFGAFFYGNDCSGNILKCLNYSVDNPIAIADLCQSFLP